MHHLVLLAAAVLAAPTQPVSGDTAAVRRAAEDVRAGLAAANAGNAAAASAAYVRAAERVPAFASWAHMLTASAAARGGDTASIRRHLALADPSLAREWGWRARVDGALGARDTAGAARIAAAAAMELQGSTRRVDAWARAGAIHAAAGRPGPASEALRRALDENVAPVSAVEAARLLGSLPAPTAEDHRRIGRVYLRHRNLDRATAAFDAYLASGRADAAERAAIQLDLGRGLFEARDYAAAERRLREAAGSGSARETAAEAAHLLGRALYRQGRPTDARAAFVRVTREHAGTTSAARAHFVIADIDHDSGRIESAKIHYGAVVESNGPDAPLAAARLGGFALLENRPREAARVFADAYRRVEGVGRQKPGYWWGVALGAAGEADSARAVFAGVRSIDPFSYYGLRAGERLGLGLWDFEASTVAVVPAALRAQIAGRLDVVDVLRAAGLEESAAFEATRILDAFSGIDGALYALGEGYHARDQTFNGIRIGRELLRREGSWNRHLLQLVYPFPYRDAVLREAAANGLDPFLVAGLIRQESMFNTRARSPAGAIGLMQVMPRTGTTIARNIGINPFQPSRLTDPVVNLRIGTRYLAEQIRNHNGRLVDAIAAYNAGPQRVNRWKQFPEYRDPELFIERIPFQETRDYVMIVQQNARIYRELYGSPGRTSFFPDE